ncbi:MAG: sigma-70 family RNA polymerase sigma factor [Clostridia bacterium]|nr:sigma-70 family RNA polymerase sigma factor [Clostridia bacterium]
MKKHELEERLIKESLSGNAESFGELVRHYERFVFNIAFSYMTNYDDAFDVAQDSFVKAWQRLSSFKGVSAFSTWLYRITVNTAKDALSERNRREKDSEIDERVPSELETPEEKMLREESARQLKKALDTLDPDMREILVLREFEEMSYAEISRCLNIEEGTVKSRLSRARERLREILREQNPENFVKTVKEKERRGN